MTVTYLEDIITISDTNTQGSQTVEKPIIIAVGAENHTLLADTTWITPALPHLQKGSPHKEERGWRQEKRRRELCAQKAEYGASSAEEALSASKKAITAIFKEVTSFQFAFQLQ